MTQKLTRLKLTNFTAFESLDVKLADRINIFVGENGTGKTHILKLLYAAAAASANGTSFGEKVASVFMPDKGTIGRLAYRRRGVTPATVEVSRSKLTLKLHFDSKTRQAQDATVNGTLDWQRHPMECAYIPVKEMLAHAPGFRSLYEKREIHFEQTYADIINRAYLPFLRRETNIEYRGFIERLRRLMGGEVVQRNEMFFLRGAGVTLEFNLVAEGFRKLALIWLLIQNGTLKRGSILFWDEPEANLNPKLISDVVQILRQLSLIGVQIFIATHSYFVLKELDIGLSRTSTESDSKILFHGLFKEPRSRKIICNSVPNYLDLSPNTIADTFADLYERDVEQALKSAGTKKG